MDQLLQHAMSSDVVARQTAETAIEQYVVSRPDDFFNDIFRIAHAEDSTKEMAHMTMLVAKAVILRHWGPEFEQFERPMLGPDTKTNVRRELLNIVGTSASPKVRATAASVVSRIGGNEFPDQWPDLLENNMKLLRSEGVALAGGLELFKELLIDTLREQDFFEIGAFVMSRLLEAADHKEHRLAALKCFHECINFFLMGDDDQLPVLEGIIKGDVNKWCLLFKHVIIHEAEETDLQDEIILTLRDLESAFPSVLGPEIPELFRTVVERVEQSRVSRNVNDELLTHQINLLDMFFRAKGSETIHRSLLDMQVLQRFLDICIAQAIIPKELQHLWIDDYNDFVIHEVELAEDIWPRPAVGNLTGDLRHPMILATLIERAKTAQTWLELESILFLITCVLQQLSFESQKLTPNHLSDIAAIVRNATQPELLHARAIITGGYILKYAGSKLSSDTKDQMLKLPFEIQSNASNVVKIAALRNISIGCTVAPEKLRSTQKNMLSLIASLVPESEEETPALLADIMMNILRLNFQDVLMDDQVYSLFFSLVSKDTANIELTVELLSFVEEIFESAEQNLETLPNIYQKLLVPVIQTLANAQASKYEFSSDLQFALDLAAVIFERGAELPDKSRLLQIFHDLVSTCDDPQILQSGSFAYAALLERLGTIELDTNAIQNVLEVAAKLLDPDLDDASGLASGRLVKAIIATFGSELGDVLSEIIIAAGTRLAAAENALLAESLTLLFFDLINRDALTIVNLLADRNILEPVLKKCLATFEVVRGADEIHGSVSALENLYDLEDPRIEAILVNDEALAPRNKILTRSATKNMKFTQVSIPIKIVKLLIRELGQSQQPDFDEDDEWADELTLGFNGEALTDRRIHGLILGWFKKIGLKDMSWYQKLTDTERTTLLEAANFK